ncbi:MAG TPA: hypothetical protein VGB29_03710, partial [Thermodesulfobacteriota bacterium]
MQEKDSHSTQVVFRDSKGCQRRSTVSAVPHIIDPNYGNVVWDAQPRIFNRFYRAKRSPVTYRKDSGWRLLERQQLLHLYIPLARMARDGRWLKGRIDCNPMFGQCNLMPSHAVAQAAVLGRPTNPA